jgi:hypothetical protein
MLLRQVPENDLRLRSEEVEEVSDQRETP